ncbi:MAG: hypothetical protein HGA79_05630 [Anaerolineales bacterium]|jgi:hypothetical protein|nr:hypothetical protein [Anaerolineales bacterium]
MNINTSSPAWHTLGELELPVEVSMDETIRAWLMEILASINLPPDFLVRVLKSAQESVWNAIHPNSEDTHSHIHFSILVPHGHTPSGKSWGFFHIERIEASADSSDERHHAIDFYLYVEGE